MKNVLRKCQRGLAFVLAFALVMTSVLQLGATKAYADTGVIAFIASEGYEEGAFANWTPVTGADSYKAYVSADGTNFTEIDAPLIRSYDSYVRVDAVGIVAGDYVIKVEALAGGAVIAEGTTESLTVTNYDRSGYAHFNNTEGVGAYNDDGTLKDNAIVLYVTDANKDTVSVTSKDGTTVEGIGNILNSTGRDVGTGANSKGGLPNTNSEIIRKLAEDGTPLVVRIIGNVTAPAGVTAYDSIDYGGTTDDNGYMARMMDGKNITIEGIGSDAVINGWGIHFMATANYLDYGKNFEVRNISFMNVPEDCVGMEGVQEGDVLNAPVERCWIHDCEFHAPTIANPAESDKNGGDGACDFKRGQYFTNSYCIYYGYHKTNLVGGSDSNKQYHITYHHNYWKDCDSRGPLARQANIHMYNNVFDGQTSYCMNPRANAYIFSEYNLFYQCKNPMQIKSGAIKSYNDSISCCYEDIQRTIVTDKSQTVSNNNLYPTFDTDATLSYIPAGDYILQEDVTEAKKVVMAYAGVLKDDPVTPGEVSVSVLDGNRMPAAAVELPYSQNFNNNYPTSTSATVDNIIFNVKKLAADGITIGGQTTGQDVVFRVNTAVNISMVDGGSEYSSVLLNEAGVALITGTGTVTNVPAGTYFIQASCYSDGKYKEAKLVSLAIDACDPNAEAPTEYNITVESDENGTASANLTKAPAGTTVTLTATPKEGYELASWQVLSGAAVVSGDKFVMPIGDVVIKANFKVATSSGGTGGGGTTGGGAIGTGFVHNFTESGLVSDFYTISGNTSNSKGTVTYGDLTLTQCLKLESKTSIGFTAANPGVLTLVFNSANSSNIKVDGEKYTFTDGILTLELGAGAHTITKADTANLFYMEFAYVSSEEPEADPVQAFVKRMYTVALGRDAEEAGVTNWVAALNAGTHDGAGIAEEFVLGEEFALRNLTDEQYVDTLYETFFNRAADEGGKELWLAVLASGQTRGYVLSNFVNLDEFTMLCSQYGIERGVMLSDGVAVKPGVSQFVKRMYTVVLGRDAENEGLYNNVLALVVGAETAESVAKNFFGSEEYVMKNKDNEAYVRDLYNTFMNREADADGLSFWTETIAVGMSRDEVLSEFAKSEEFKAIAASYGLN